MLVSIIIPTLNEEDRIRDLVEFLRNLSGERVECEVIVADAGSGDHTIQEASLGGAYAVRVPHGRARQMNHGASLAKGDILFFLHADTRPPNSFLSDVASAVEEGYSAGCYRLSFDDHHWFLRFNCWFTRFNLTPFRFGDQGLFITRELFESLGGFDSDLFLMEDQEIVKRIKKIARFKVLESAVVTSARKYLENGIFKLQFTFIVIYILYKLGISQFLLVKIYRRFIRENRVEAIEPQTQNK